jgi:two-component system cell cycle response regulator
MDDKRILIVDDNETNLKLLGRLLSFSGYELATATTARLALEVIASFRPQLILLDIQLPDVDGLTLARRLKADPQTQDILIIAVTAYAMKGDEERARAAGVDDYLTKPIDKDVLRQTVAKYLNQGGTDAPAVR